MKIGRIKIVDKFVIRNRMRDDDTPYITRWRIFDSPWFGIFVHRMHRPDAQPVHHNHPWAFVSFILRGGYRESFIDPADGEVKVRQIRWFNRKGLADAHYIVALDRLPTWTLVFVGRTRRKWGYVIPTTMFGQSAGTRFVPWDESEFHKHLERP